MKFFYKLGTTENLSSQDSVCLRMAVNFVLCFNTLNCEYWKLIVIRAVSSILSLFTGKKFEIEPKEYAFELLRSFLT